MSISTIPDLCLLSVFDRIPLQYLDQLSLVCRRWNELQTYAYCRRRSLTLVISNRCYRESSLQDYYNFLIRNAYNKGSSKVDIKKVSGRVSFSMLQFSTLTNKDVGLLVSRFPNITKLVLVLRRKPSYNGIDLLAKICCILQQYSGKLSTLHLLLIHPQKVAPTLNLFNSLNLLSTLKRLILEVYLSEDNAFAQAEFPLLSRLQHFGLMSNNNFCEIFRNYAATNDGLQISIGNTIGGMNMLKDFLSLSPKLKDKFVQLDMLGSFRDSFRDQWYGKFTSLTTANLRLDLNISKMTYLLSSLINLKNLRFYYLEYKENTNLIPYGHFIPLPSVMILELGFPTTSHDNLNLAMLSAIFPNLEHIEMQPDGQCVICGILFNGKVGEWKKAQKCVRKMLHWFPGRSEDFISAQL